MDFTFDYSKIHPKFHAGDVGETIVLYKGAICEQEHKGFSSLALKQDRLDHLLEVKSQVESGDEDAIHEILDRHTSYYHFTPFLSAHPNPQWAQVFANPMSRLGKTIYQITLPAQRCIIDHFDTGNCGIQKEVMILGTIFSYEITAFKIRNDEYRFSELLSECGRLVQRIPKRDQINTHTLDPSNWAYLV